ALGSATIDNPYAFDEREAILHTAIMLPLKSRARPPWFPYSAVQLALAYFLLKRKTAELHSNFYPSSVALSYYFELTYCHGPNNSSKHLDNSLILSYRIQ